MIAPIEKSDCRGGFSGLLSLFTATVNQGLELPPTPNYCNKLAL